MGMGVGDISDSSYNKASRRRVTIQIVFGDYQAARLIHRNGRIDSPITSGLP
jgi:hypothetical protein